MQKPPHFFALMSVFKTTADVFGNGKGILCFPLKKQYLFINAERGRIFLCEGSSK